ncbi:MAG: FAD binding domain-containing protein [Candidatus Limnocylindria bacterium]
MKAAPFWYRRASSVSEAVSLLADHDGEPKLLAGGQSLVPMMAFRLARPDLLVDINPIGELAFLQGGGEGEPLRIGALTRTAELEDPSQFSGAWSVVPELATRIGHLPIRRRGTVGGSLAHADPAAELPVFALAVDAELACTGPGGTRVVPAADFFSGMFQTALDGDEMLTEVRCPALPPGTAATLVEFARRAGDFALVLVVAALSVTDGRIAEARLAVGGVGPVPLRARAAEEVLRGQAMSAALFADAANAAQRDIDPGSDIHASAAYRRRLTDVLCRRALTAAASRASVT